MESDLLVKLLFIAGIVFLLWVWSFWADLQVIDEFHPDGLKRCPPETYTIVEDDNRNSSKLRCVSCPVCPAGEEPLPPCETTLTVKTRGECTLCRPGTYSDDIDHNACKGCTDCGSRNVKASCTSEKNTECEDCPWKYYEDDVTQICKHCSSCCGRNSPALMECLLTKKCRGRCNRTTRMKHLNLIFNRLVEKSMNGSYNTTPFSSGTNLEKDNHDNSKLLVEDTTNTAQNNITRSVTKRDIKVQDQIPSQSQEDYKDITNSQGAEKVFEKNELEDLEFLEIPDILKNAEEKADILGTIQDPSPIKNSFKDTDEQAVENEVPTVQSEKVRDRNLFQDTTSTTTAENMLGQLTTHSSVTLTTSAQTQLINPSSFLSSFAGTIAAVLVLGLIGLIIYVAFQKCRHKGYKKLRGSPKPEEQLHDPFDEFYEKEDRDFSGDETMDTETTAATELEDLNLSEIPPDLENILVMNLDVPHRADCKEFGWQKVGTAAGIPGNELKYYKYSREQSPTKLLLEKLGSQGRTISYLIDVLPRVELGSVAKTIRHRVTRI